MGIFEDLLRNATLEAYKGPGLSPDFKATQATPNVYTPAGYPTLEQVSQQRAQNPYSMYAPPAEINMDTLSAYGRQLSGQRQPSPYVPVATPVTDKLSQDTFSKLVGAKAARLANTLKNIELGNRPNMPALTDAQGTAEAFQGLTESQGAEASSPSNAANTAAAMGSLADAMGTHSMADVGAALSAYGSLGFAPGSLAAAAIGESLSDAAASIGFGVGEEGMAGISDAATTEGSFGLGAMGPANTGFGIGNVGFADALGSLGEAESSESDSMGEAAADGDGDGDGDGGDGGGDGSSGDGDGDGGDGDGGDGDGGGGDGGGGDGGGGDGGGGDGGGGGERAGGLIDKEKKAALAYKRGEITFKELCRMLR